MAYVYLTDMFHHIDQCLADARDAYNNADADTPGQQFESGRVEALTDFKQFLEKQYIPKLPARIRKSFTDRQ